MKIHARKYDKFGLVIPGMTLCNENTFSGRGAVHATGMEKYIDCKKCLLILKKKELGSKL